MVFLWFSYGFPMVFLWFSPLKPPLSEDISIFTSPCDLMEKFPHSLQKKNSNCLAGGWYRPSPLKNDGVSFSNSWEHDIPN